MPEIFIPDAGLKYRMEDPNVYVLDSVKIALGDGAWSANPYRILDADRYLRDAIGAEQRAGHMTQPWVTLGRTPKKHQPFRLLYTFRIDALPETAVDLAVETPEVYTITVNGIPLETHSDKWWVDPCLRRLPLPFGALREGLNTIEVSGVYTELSQGLETMFLLGGFGVTPGGNAICRLPETLHKGDVVGQGFPNYAGNLTYIFQAAVPAEGPCRIRLSEFAGVAIGVRVNGGEQHFLPWPPYETVFTDADGLRRDGQDTFEIKVYGSRRNAFGPFYVPGGVKWPVWTGPWQMGCCSAPSRALVPFGLGVVPDPTMV